MGDLLVLYGNSIILRPLKESDIDDRQAIGRHSEFVHMCGGDSFIDPAYPDRAVWEAWYARERKNPYSLIIEYCNRCVGIVRLSNISQTDKSASFSIGIFDPALYSEGIGTAATKLMLRYGFEQLGLHRIELKVLEYNKRAIRCYEKCGFKVDGILRESAFIDGEFHSDIVMSILENEWHAKSI